MATQLRPFFVNMELAFDIRRLRQQRPHTSTSVRYVPAADPTSRRALKCDQCDIYVKRGIHFPILTPAHQLPADRRLTISFNLR